jgi:hypothetical protein
MSEITTPKDILEDTLRDLLFKPFGNRWQRWFFKFACWTLHSYWGQSLPSKSAGQSYQRPSSYWSFGVFQQSHCSATDNSVCGQKHGSITPPGVTGKSSFQGIIFSRAWD